MVYSGKSVDGCPRVRRLLGQMLRFLKLGTLECQFFAVNKKLLDQFTTICPSIPYRIRNDTL